MPPPLPTPAPPGLFTPAEKLWSHRVVAAIVSSGRRVKGATEFSVATVCNVLRMSHTDLMAALKQLKGNGEVSYEGVERGLLAEVLVEPSADELQRVATALHRKTSELERCNVEKIDAIYKVMVHYAQSRGGQAAAEAVADGESSDERRAGGGGRAREEEEEVSVIDAAFSAAKKGRAGRGGAADAGGDRCHTQGDGDSDGDDDGTPGGKPQVDIQQIIERYFGHFTAQDEAAEAEAEAEAQGAASATGQQVLLRTGSGVSYLPPLARRRAVCARPQMCDIDRSWQKAT
eukprot:COSAG01_NODE_969_length_12378_cov_41.649320_5_plen_289_part_00